MVTSLWNNVLLELLSPENWSRQQNQKTQRFPKSTKRTRQDSEEKTWLIKRQSADPPFPTTAHIRGFDLVLHASLAPTSFKLHSQSKTIFSFRLDIGPFPSREDVWLLFENLRNVFWIKMSFISFTAYLWKVVGGESQYQLFQQTLDERCLNVSALWWRPTAASPAHIPSHRLTK